MLFGLGYADGSGVLVKVVMDFGGCCDRDHERKATTTKQATPTPFDLN